MRTSLCIPALALLLSACGGGPTAELTVFAVGDNRIDAGDWVVDVTKWITTIDHVQLSDEKDRVVGEDDNATVVVDLIDAAQPVEIEIIESQVGSWTLNFGSEAPLRTSPRATRFITDVEVVEMETNGWSHIIEGRAIGPAELYKSQPIYDFRFGFGASVRNLGCGAVEVLEDGSGEVTIEMVADPWLDRRPGASLPDVTFAHVAAADRDGDLQITSSELQATSLATAGVPADDGSQDLYGWLVGRLGLTLQGPEDCAIRNQ